MIPKCVVLIKAQTFFTEHGSQREVRSFPVDEKGGGSIGVDARVPQPLRFDDRTQQLALLAKLSLHQSHGAPFCQRSENTIMSIS